MSGEALCYRDPITIMYYNGAVTRIWLITSGEREIQGMKLGPVIEPGVAQA